MAKHDLMYSSETGDIEEQQQGAVAVDPLRVPGIVENFMTQYIPADDERTATDVMGFARLREELACWPPYSCKEDPLQEYLDLLAEHGYIMRNTASGPALCLIDTGSGRVVDSGYEQYEEIE